MHRLVAAALVFAVLVPLSALAQDQAVPDCSKKFVSMWSENRDEAFHHLPKRTCRMYGETGQYLCNRRGCQRP